MAQNQQQLIKLRKGEIDNINEEPTQSIDLSTLNNNIMKPTIINLKALKDITNKLQSNIQTQVKQAVIKQGCSTCGAGSGTVK